MLVGGDISVVVNLCVLGDVHSVSVGVVRLIKPFKPIRCWYSRYIVHARCGGLIQGDLRSGEFLPVSVYCVEDLSFACDQFCELFGESLGQVLLG